MATRWCVNNPGAFSYNWRYSTLIRQRRNITSFVKRAYKVCFGLTLGNQDKKFAPRTVRHNCEEMLRDWTKRKRKGLPFGIPIIWRELKDHTTDCYFVWSVQRVLARKNRYKITYPRIQSAIRPSLHSDELPVQFLLICLHLKTKCKRLTMLLKKYRQIPTILMIRQCNQLISSLVSWN